MPINVALLGSGVFAQASYLPALLALSTSPSPPLHFRTIWSRSLGSAQTLHSKYTTLLPSSSSQPEPLIQHGDDGLEAVLASSEIDAVLLVLPITKQPELVRRAWRAGKHVLSEKPLGKDVEQARGLVQEYEREWKPKGLIWRVAENYAHEPVLRFAGDLLANTPQLGPVLYWQLKFEAYVEDGSKYQATAWRTIPDYQGGFLLDGGVHWAALLRTVLPPPPAPPPSSPPPTFTAPTSSRTTPAENKEEDVVGGLGGSSPAGQILMSFARADMPHEGQTANGLTITCLHGTLSVLLTPNREFVATLIPANGSGLEKQEKRSGMEGVQVEIGMFARAVGDVKAGRKVGEEDFGEPRGAIWDLAVVEGMLKSGGKPVELEALLKGK
ncbi:hypothetical protein IAT38_004068 [Cryptococcus sp. DSM 104549]